MVHEEVLCIRYIVRVVIVTLSEIILQLIHQLDISSLVGSTHNLHSEVLYFCGFGC